MVMGGEGGLLGVSVKPDYRSRRYYRAIDPPYSSITLPGIGHAI